MRSGASRRLKTAGAHGKKEQISKILEGGVLAGDMNSVRKGRKTRQRLC